MSSSTSVSILFTISSTLLLLLLFSKSVSSSMINDTCTHAYVKNFDAKSCIETLESYEQISSAKDYYDFTIEILKVGIKNMTATRANMIKKLDQLQSSKSNDAMKPVLQQCIGSYENVIGNFESARQELKENVDTISASYDLVLASNDGIQPCFAAVSSANVTDESVVSGNKYLWVYMISAGTSVDQICNERKCNT